jgi:hypothetical protein
LTVNRNSGVGTHGIMMRCKNNQQRILPRRQPAVTFKYA